MPRALVGNPAGRESRRQAAIMGRARRDGFKFIRLVWANPSRREVIRVDESDNEIFAIISGVETYEGQPFENPTTRMLDYHCYKSTGQLKFAFSHDYGTAIADILDTEYNRDFLASHLEVGKWELETDDDVIKDLQDRKAKLEAQMVQFKNKCVDEVEKLRYHLEAKEGVGRDEDPKEAVKRVNNQAPPVLQREKVDPKFTEEKKETNKKRSGTIAVKLPDDYSPRGMIKP